ncbi:MAG: dihydrolipoyl dehydrogenase [Candidatus Lokiarchaeota archaeon]|nr:dihydrolipoyl dehydrogenase [Candidatus Lokiarchaeota archaeon]
MSEQEVFDLIVIGSGPGGYHAALRAAQYGAKVAIIEKRSGELGGTCSNWGCIPTKALVASANMLEELHEKAEDFGITVGNVEFNFMKAVERKNKVVTELREGIEGLLNIRKIPIHYGFGKLEGGSIAEEFTVSVAPEQGEKIFLKGKRVIIATGSTPALIPAFNIDHNKILTSDDILNPDFKILPKSLLIIGAGVIGCEFGNIFRRFGVDVTMLEYLPTMIATEERLVIKELQKKFDEIGIKLHVKQNVLKVENTETGVKATTCDASIPRDQVDSAEKFTYEAELCLVSIGRAKESVGIGLEELGGKIERNSIVVNEKTRETDVVGVYAIGDVTAGPMLAHKASYDGDVAVANALSSIGGFDVHPREADYSVLPATIFTNPEIGSVGIREKDAKDIAKDKGSKIYTGRFYYASLGKAKCMNTEEGFMMIIADADSDKILGASCIGHGAPELIATVSIAMDHGITATELGHSIYSHPTISEMVLETAEDVHGMAIHKAGRRR